MIHGWSQSVCCPGNCREKGHRFDFLTRDLSHGLGSHGLGSHGLAKENRGSSTKNHNSSPSPILHRPFLHFFAPANQTTTINLIQKILLQQTTAMKSNH